MGIWDWNIRTGRLDWSPQHLRLFGYEEGEFKNDYESFRPRIHPDDIDEVERRTALMRESEQKFQWIYRVIWPDGSIHYIEAVGGVVARIEGHAARVIGTAVDITARKLADEELWHARRCLEQRVRNGPRNWKPPTAPLLEGKRLF